MNTCGFTVHPINLYNGLTHSLMSSKPGGRVGAYDYCYLAVRIAARAL